jgi:hypothetical protein
LIFTPGSVGRGDRFLIEERGKNGTLFLNYSHTT